MSGAPHKTLLQLTGFASSSDANRLAICPGCDDDSPLRCACEGDGATLANADEYPVRFAPWVDLFASLRLADTGIPVIDGSSATTRESHSRKNNSLRGIPG